MKTEIQEWMDKHLDKLGSGTYWLETLDDEEGQPCLRTWALHILKHKKPELKEVVREYLDGDIKVHGDLYFIGAKGYTVNWGTSKSYYIPKELDDNWYLVDLKQRPGMSATRLFHNKDLNSIFKKYIPYFQMSENLNIMEYAKRYQEYSSAELLAKAGFEYLIMDKRVLKLSKPMKKKLIHWLMVQENNDYVKSHHPLYNDISRAMAKGWTMEKYYYENTIDEYEKKFSSEGFTRTREECEEVYRYLNGVGKHPIQLIGLHDYIDYLKTANELGFDMTLKSTIYPLNGREAHDSLVRTKQEKESKELNEQLSKIATILKGYEIKKKDLKIVIPTSQKDFIEWGKRLQICVGTCGYDKKMVRGDCIILMVYLNDQPLECCELTIKERSKNVLKIEQLRGEHNGDSPRHEDCKNLVNQFIHNYRNKHYVGACI